jgi:DNA-binding MarR family transcriptional regulator
VEHVVNLARTAKRIELSDPKRPYPDTIGLIERLHHRFLDVINDELVRCGERDISGIQSLLLFNFGDQELQVGELHSRDLYLGTNASYIVKRLVEGGYLHCERGTTDRRSVLIRLTRKGEAIRDLLAELFERHLSLLDPVGDDAAADLDTLNVTLNRLNRFWIDQVRFQL